MFASLLGKVLDLIFPPKQNSAKARELSVEDIALSPTSHEALGIDIITLCSYKTTQISTLIRALKYERSTLAAKTLASLLSDFLIEQIAEEETFSDKKLVLVPIPLTKKRKRSRGYNQMEIVLQHLQKQMLDNIEVHPEFLIRIKETPQQTRLSRNERLANLSGAFSVPENAPVKDLHIILIDDVTTTGATLMNAAKTLEEKGAKVTPLAFSRA